MYFPYPASVSEREYPINNLIQGGGSWLRFLFKNFFFLFLRVCACVYVLTRVEGMGLTVNDNHQLT